MQHSSSTALLDLKSSLVPVTALLSLGNIVLAGEGFSLCIYHTKSKALLFNRRIFKSQAVHGFCRVKSCDLEDEVLVWGGALVRRVCLHWTGVGEHLVVDRVSIGFLSTCTDWILDVCPGSDEAHSRDGLSQQFIAFAVTAHDELLGIDISGQVTTLSTGSNCLLFSAHLVSLGSNQLLVASGTSFGQILVWTWSLTSVDGEKCVHHVFLGHEGSVFGVRISDPISLDSGDILRLLSSCSDDRTIRVWDISDLSSALTLDQSQDIANSTGYANTISKGCIASIMGHVSRIWRLRYIYTSQTTSFVVRIVSVGEDGSALCWDLQSKSDEPGVYYLESALSPYRYSGSINCHSGKNIWSLDIKDPKSASPIVYTGGADGRISEFSLHSNLLFISAPDVEAEPTKENDPVNRLRPPSYVNRVEKHLKALNGFRTLSLTPRGIFVVTKGGSVDLCTINSREIKSIAYAVHDLKERTTSRSISGGKYVLVASSLGNVYMYDHETGSFMLIFKSEKRMQDIWVAEIDDASTNVLVSGIRDPILVNTRLSHSEGSVLKVTAIWKLQIHRSIAISSVQKRCQNGYLVVLGHRNGDISIFVCQDLDSEFDMISASYMLEHAHGNGEDAVTDLLWLETKNSKAGIEHLVSVGRDGTLAIFEIDVAKDCWMKRLHTTHLPFIGSLEGVWHNAVDSTFVVWGFTSNSFVAYSLDSEKPIMIVPCGGRHRHFDYESRFHSDSGTVGGTFVWVQQSTLWSLRTQTSFWGILKDGGHGQDIKTCGIAPRNGFKTKFGRLCATGGEDTDITLFCWSETGCLSKLSILRKHVSGVQAVKWAADSRRLFSSGAGEELLVWRLSHCPVVGVGVVCESKQPIAGGKSELRITAFDVVTLAQAESRGEFLVTIGLSNCSFKVCYILKRF
jgi:WD repeat-containing protein 6